MTLIPEDYQKVLENALASASQLEKEMSEKALDLTFDNTYQKREYNKHITTISVAVLGLAPVLADHVKIHSYYYTAIAVLIFEILFLIIRLREELDSDQNGLMKIPRGENPFVKAVDTSRKYLLMDKTEENAASFSSEIQKLREDAQARLDASGTSERLDYTLEFIISLFFISILFLLFSILLEHSLRSWLLTIIILAVFLGSFFTSTFKIMVPINYLLNHLPWIKR